MRHFLLGLAVLITLAAPAYAQEFTPPTTDLSKAPAGIYRLDQSHASLTFKILHMGTSLYTGRFNTLDATIHFDPAHVDKSIVEASIDMASVDTHNTKLEEELRSDMFLDSGKFPKATFKSTRLVQNSPTQGTMTGDLSFHGVTKPITFEVTLHGLGQNPMTKKPTLGFGATATISRSGFGVSKYVPMVGDDVQLIIEGEFPYTGPATTTSAGNEPPPSKPATDKTGTTATASVAPTVAPAPVPAAPVVKAPMPPTAPSVPSFTK